MNKLFQLPDAVNASISKNFTQIPNDLLRNPEISGKAKAILCILLSNKEGWTTYITNLQKMMKEGLDAIRSGVSELEEFGYLIRVRYRDKTTKKWVGSFWCYTDIPGSFDISRQQKLLEKQNCETFINKEDEPHMENPHVASSHVENPTLIILKDNNTKKEKNKKREEEDARMGKPTSKHFEMFWELYPKKTSKGAALTAWEKLCRLKNRPQLNTIKTAVTEQSKSKQWQDKQYIPNASTWLNQSRWLDDPNEMNGFNKFERNKHSSKLHNSHRSRSKIEYKQPKIV
jgi:hypothetical protein